MADPRYSASMEPMVVEHRPLRGSRTCVFYVCVWIRAKVFYECVDVKLNDVAFLIDKNVWASGSIVT